MKMHANYDVVYYASEAYKQVLVEGFKTPAEKFKKFTLPRIDLLNDEQYINKTREAIFNKYPQLKEKNNVIYAPTFPPPLKRVLRTNSPPGAGGTAQRWGGLPPGGVG